MAIQPEDKKTADIFDLQPAIAAAAVEKEDLYLAEHHDLVRVQAYIKNPETAKAKTSNNLRQARFAEKLKKEGLVKTHIPAESAQAIKQAGGFSAWLDAQKVSAVAPTVERVEVPGPERIVEVPGPVRIEYRDVPGPERIIEVEKIVSVPASPTEKDIQLKSLGKRCALLSGWRRAVVFKILGVK
jgi:hypothetical protein